MSVHYGDDEPPTHFKPFEEVNELQQRVVQFAHRKLIVAGILNVVTTGWDLTVKKCENCFKEAPQQLVKKWNQQRATVREIEREEGSMEPSRVFSRWCGYCLLNFTKEGDSVDEWTEKESDDRIGTCWLCHWLITHNEQCAKAKTNPWE